MPLFVENLHSEEMDIICEKLKTRGVETSLEIAAQSWAAIKDARKNNDIGLLRAYDACYSARDKPRIIKDAYCALSITVGHGEVLTPEALASYKLVINALSKYRDANPDVTISLHERERVVGLALSNPSYGEGISRIILERGVVAPEQIRGIIELAMETEPALSEGTL